MIRTAILVDGGFYRKRAKYLWGVKDAEGRARELEAYCRAHIADHSGPEVRQLYRIFYYDSEPLARKTVYHPLLKKNIELEKSDTAIWAKAFFEELKRRRKFALRLGHISNDVGYNLKRDVTKDLCGGKRTVDSLTEADFEFHAQQKGVDMKIGVDIASLAYKHQVDQIILIAGDSDFVPAAKLARREGIDFILDPMWANIRDDLFEHIDGLKSQWGRPDRQSDRAQRQPAAAEKQTGEQGEATSDEVPAETAASALAK